VPGRVRRVLMHALLPTVSTHTQASVASLCRHRLSSHNQGSACVTGTLLQSISSGTALSDLPVINSRGSSITVRCCPTPAGILKTNIVDPPGGGGPAVEVQGINFPGVWEHQVRPPIPFVFSSATLAWQEEARGSQLPGRLGAPGAFLFPFVDLLVRFVAQEESVQS